MREIADGNPIGAPQQGNVWLSSTDPNIKERNFGQGTGNNLGFAGHPQVYQTTQQIKY